MPSAVLAYTRNNNGGTDVTCKNIFNGKCVTRTLQINPTQLVEWSLNPRALVQDVFPHLTASEREFLMTGCTDEDWDAMFGDDDADT